jgi:hypothetical protein
VIATGIVRSLLTAATKAGSEYWSEESKIWNATNGYPRCGHALRAAPDPRRHDRVPEQRLGLEDRHLRRLHERRRPTTTASSSTSSASSRTRSSTSAIKQLLALGYGGEFSIRGGIEKPITPTNAQVKPESSYGVKRVRPVSRGHRAPVIQRAGRKVRLARVRAGERQLRRARHLDPLRAHHRGRHRRDAAYAQEPDSVVGLVRADGQLVTLSINREQEVLGWGRKVTDGVSSSRSAPSRTATRTSSGAS